jgi:hypothetical protein
VLFETYGPNVDFLPLGRRSEEKKRNLTVRALTSNREIVQLVLLIGTLPREKRLVES